LLAAGLARRYGWGMRFPRWALLALVPFAVLAACAVYLQLHWNDIPPRFPVHWGSNGPNGWEGRTFLGVYSVLIFGAGMAAVLIAVGLVTYRGSRGAVPGAILLKIFIAVACGLAVAFSGTSLRAVGTPAQLLGVAVVVCIPGLIIFIVATAARAVAQPDAPPEDGWKSEALGIYYNPRDPALFVPKPAGGFSAGYTFNFANRLSWVILVGLIGGIGALIAFLVWAQG